MNLEKGKPGFKFWVLYSYLSDWASYLTCHVSTGSGSDVVYLVGLQGGYNKAKEYLLIELLRSPLTFPS
jgi:hypothetical protein